MQWPTFFVIVAPKDWFFLKKKHQLCPCRISDSEAARQREWERLCREQEMAEEAAQREMEREAQERRRKDKEKFRGFLAEQQVSKDE